MALKANCYWVTNSLLVEFQTHCIFMLILQTWNLGKSSTTGKSFYCWMLNIHAMPIKLPLHIEVYTHTLVPIVYIVLVNYHVLFELTAKQALKARTISDLSMSQIVFPSPLSGNGLISLIHWQRRKRAASSPRANPHVLDMNLETSHFQKRLILSNSWHKGACSRQEGPEVQSAYRENTPPEFQLPQLPSLVSDRHVYLIWQDLMMQSLSTAVCSFI